MNDLDFDTDGDGDVDADDAYWNAGLGWEPIGGNVAPRQVYYSRLNGVFEGNGHTISNLHINRPDRQYIGLFGAVGPGGLIRNLILEDGNINGRDRVGALAGRVFGTISNSSATGAVTGAGRDMGGLVGRLEGTVEASYAAGQVEGTRIVGGLVGYLHKDGRISRSYATASVTSTGGDAGGLAGVLSGRAEATYATGSVTAAGTAGGLVGALRGTVEASYSTGEVQSGEGNVGGLVGLVRGARAITNGYWDTETSSRATSAGGTGKTTAELQTPAGYSGIYANWNLDLDSDGNADDPWDFGTTGQYPALQADWDGDGQATVAEFGSQIGRARSARQANRPPAFSATSAEVSVAENTAAGINIGNPVEATDPDGDTLAYTLGAAADDDHFDIDAGSGQLKTSGALDYEGQNSYTVTVTATDGGGLSASIAVTITVTNVAERVDYDADGDGLIEVVSIAQLNAIRWDLDGDGNSANAGYGVAFPDATAGMGCPDSGCSGYELAADLDFDTDGDGNVDAADAYWDGGAGWEPLGGNVGLKRPSDPAFNAVFDGNGHTIANLHINQPGRKSVGLFGAVGRNGTIRNLSLTNANVTSRVNVGALAGINFGVVEAVHVSGSVAGGENVGGLVGFVHEDGRVSRSYATASVTGAKTNVGGLVGHLRGAMQDSYATGSVTSGDTAGGLVGVLLGTVEDSYATGTVQGGRNVGGLAGLSRRATVTASYWNTETSGQAGSKGGAGQTTAELQAPTGATGIYADWDTNIWDFGTSSQYPALKTDWDGDGQATAAEFGSQPRAAPVVANRAPTFAGSVTEFSVAENTAGGTAIGDPVEATDLDGDSLTYALGTTADDGHFAIDDQTGQLKTKGALDYEGTSSYSVTVTATDGGGLTAGITVTITTTNVNEAPSFAGSATTVSVAENTASGVNIGELIKATDLDAGDTLAYTLGSTAADGHFAINADSGQLKTKGTLDYESTSSYSVTVTATDGGGLAASIAVTITVDDVDETPRPGNVQAALQSDGSVLVTWEAPAGAGDGDGDDTFYRVRRRLDAADSNYQVIARRVEDADNDGAAEYRDAASNLEAGQSYLYSVRAFDGNGDNIGKWTEGVKVSIPAN